MNKVFPPGVSEKQFTRALAAFTAIVGKEYVLATDEDRYAYLDPYGFSNLEQYIPAAAVAPASTEEVQAIVRAANEHKIPLWPVSRGKNFGYGGPAPLMSGSVVLDLGRMNRILEVNEKHGYCLIEPGVGFFDLFNYLQENNIPLWMSVPGNAWGSVIGNALERGLGYTPYGDNTSKLCGLEVVLPDGDLLRTGMGAMSGNKGWQLYQYGFGPAWDQLFVQSNFGIVTRAGMWLMPEPEATSRVRIHLPKPEDIGWVIDELAQLRLRNVIEHTFVLGNYLHDASVFSQRDQWYQGKGAIPDEVSQKIIEHYNIGWWSFSLSLFGYADSIKVHEKLIRNAIEPHLGKALEFQHWHRGEPLQASAAGIPGTLPLQIVNWRGGRGGHLGFSPVMPPDGKLVLEAFRKRKARYEEFGHDYYTSFTMGQRHINNINLIIYDRDDAEQTTDARALFMALMEDARREGYGEYRTHLMFMDEVVQTFDFNNHALLRLNEKIKNTLDPNGILAPGKSGIWPDRYKGNST